MDKERFKIPETCEIYARNMLQEQEKKVSITKNDIVIIRQLIDMCMEALEKTKSKDKKAEILNQINLLGKIMN